ncbi:LamG-like jellyroll fold domain-containing protein [Tautonia sp. JC769]|uniref:LamG domain-containing protein n=1 Tax=Tautonia sp. JC769 TaxID=3232135 RepID=UPI00345B203E
METGVVDFAFACWVRVNERPPGVGFSNSRTHIASKWGTGSEWLLCLNSPTGADQFCFTARGASSANSPRSAIPGGIELGRWYFVVAWHDATTNPSGRTLNLSVDGQTVASVPYSGSPLESWTSFTLGATANAGGYPPISLSRAAFFKNAQGGIGSSIQAMIATLYGGGSGADLEQLSPEDLRNWGTVAYWPLDELEGTRRNIYTISGGRNLSDSSGIGSVGGPFRGRPPHDSLATGWTDQLNGRTFSSPGCPWRGDSARVFSNTRDRRFEHGEALLSGRSAWTATVTGAARSGLGFSLYGESEGAGDDHFLELRVDHDGVPELAIKPVGHAEEVVRASDSLAGLRSIAAATTEAMPLASDSVPRVRCLVTVGPGHPFATTDVIRVSGLGPPFDGEHWVTYATEEAVHYVVDNPTAPPATAGARRFSGGSPASNPAPERVVPDTLDHRFPGDWSGSEWSVAGWVRKTSEAIDGRAGGSGLFAAKDAADLRVLGTRPQILHAGDGSPGTYRLDLPGGPSATFGDAPLESWVHLAAVRSGNAITLYRDGLAVATLDVSSDPTWGSIFSGFSFGGNAEMSAGLPCLLDNWGIWLGRALSAAEVGTLFGGGTGVAFAGLPAGLKSGLTAWYDFDEVSGTAVDASGKYPLRERGLVSSGEGLGGGIPFGSAVSMGRVRGTGCTQIADEFTTDAGRALEYRRWVLTVRRSGSDVSFFRNGALIGSGTLPPELLGPSSGVSRILGTSNRFGAPHGAIEHVHLAGSALDDATTFGLAARFSVRLSQSRGVGPLGVLFDATMFPGVDPMAPQDYDYLWSFVRAGTQELHDPFLSPVSGQAYARSTGFFVSQVFENEGEYDAHLVVLTPRYNRRGEPQPQSCLFAGKVATITVDPWPAHGTTYYVSSTHPDRSDSGPGTSPDTPLASIAHALTRLTCPYTRILFRRGDVFPFSGTLSILYRRGPMMLGSYGDPAAEKPILLAPPNTEGGLGHVSLEENSDLRFLGIASREQTSRTKPAFRFWGKNFNLTFQDADIRESGMCFHITNGDRATIVDRSYLGAASDYTLYSEGGFDVSLTRCAMEAFPGQHFVRLNQSQRSHVAHCYRNESPYPITRTWFTPRHQTRFFVVTDSSGDNLQTVIGSTTEHHTGIQWGLIERNNLRFIDLHSSSSTTVRGNVMVNLNQPEHINKHIYWRDEGASRSRRAEDGRGYGNQLLPTYSVRHWLPDRTLLVNESNFNYSPEAALVPPTVIPIAEVPGGTVLAASGFGAGGPEPWSLRWMRRPAGGDAPFEPLVGHKSASIVDRSATPGSYEYRIDLVTVSGLEAVGSGVLTVEIPGNQSGYRIEVPAPAECFAGESSRYFRVSLQGDPPASPVTITPRSNGPGHFDPPSVVLSAEALSAQFRFVPDPTPAGVGTWLISTLNDASMVDPDPKAFTVLAQVTDPPTDPSDPPTDPTDPPTDPGDPPTDPGNPPAPPRPNAIRLRLLPDVTPPVGISHGGLAGFPQKRTSTEGASSQDVSNQHPLSPPPASSDSIRGDRGGSPASNGRPLTPWFRRGRN